MKGLSGLATIVALVLKGNWIRLISLKRPVERPVFLAAANFDD